MSTIREQILAQITTQLEAVTEATGGVFRSRVTALARAETPAIVVEPFGDETADPNVLGVIQWALPVRVAVIVRGEIPDQLADPIVDHLHQCMILDKSLGGLSMDIEPTSVKFELVSGDLPVGVISCAYMITYRTSAGDLSQLA